MTSTEIIQRKLNELGFNCPITGVIGTVSNYSDGTRLAIKAFKKSTGIGNDIYINRPFLEKLDSVYNQKIPYNSYPISAFKGWNLSLNISDSKPADSNSANIIDRTAPDSEIIIDEQQGEISDDKMMYIGGGLALLIVLYLMKNKKKKRKRK